MTGKPMRTWRYLPFALMLSVGLLLVSFARIAGDSQTMVFSDAVLDSAFAGGIWGTRLSVNLALFASALIVLHLVYGAICWAFGRLAWIAWPSAKTTQRSYVLLTFLLLTIALLANNAVCFPSSSLGEPYAEALMQPIAGISVGRWIALAILGITAVTCAAGLLKLWQAGKRPARRVWPWSAVLAIAGAGWILMGLGTPPKPAAAQPNVILIGLDSLRSDMLARETSPGVTPHAKAIMDGGVQFSNALAPLARTFPSMTTILTGRHPHSTGAVMNLLPRDMIHEGDTLGRIFQRAGYATAYATDEVRFSNIDESYGFDRIVTPPIGSSEFVIALVADTPLSNAIVNTRLGKFLFPHVHANRAAAVTYDPDMFIERIESEIPFAQPLFLGVHLTLSHWPYKWVDSPPMNKRVIGRWPEYYLNAAARVDQQLGDLLELLERKGILSNAIVVVYSDHGESFGTPEDSLVPEADPLIVELNAKPYWGHGTSVLSSNQYRVVLGMRGYGRARFSAGEGRVVTAAVSTEDIAPTLVNLTSVHTAGHFDGRLLTPLLLDAQDAEQPFAGRIRFTETEYMPPNIGATDGKISLSAFEKASLIYTVNRDSDRIEMKRDRLAGLLSERQYAAVGETLLLAAIPDPDGPVSHHFVVLDKDGGIPTRMDGAPTADAPVELKRLWTALHTEFEGIIPAAAESVDKSIVADSPVANSVRVLTSSVNK